MRVLLIHPTGNQNVRALISAFDRVGMLAKFATTIAMARESAWINLMYPGLRRELMRRVFPVGMSQIIRRPMLEFCRLLLGRLGWNRAVGNEHGFASIDKVYADLDKYVARRLRKARFELDAVYAYEDGALEIFKAAKELGLICVYDLPIAYWETGRVLMQQEGERLPEWKRTLGGGITDSPRKLERKTEELRLADVVVVPGKFVRDSLPVWAGKKKIIVSPFGSPEPGPSVERKMDGPLRVLFVGSMGQRKGLGDLFMAVKTLDPDQIELVVLGSLLAPPEFYEHQLLNLRLERGRSHEAVLELMRSCDVFCLPSVVEGRALVMQEAMSQGLPLLITPNTGGEDLVIECETGFLVPVNAPAKIAERLTWFMENRKETAEMGRKAKMHAAKYTWQAYGDLIIHELKELYGY